MNEKKTFKITRNLHCTQPGSSCPCRSLLSCSAQLWKKDRVKVITSCVRKERTREETRKTENWTVSLPSEAQTDLPVAASSMGCFLAMLTLMWTSPTVVPFNCEAKRKKKLSRLIEDNSNWCNFSDMAFYSPQLQPGLQTPSSQMWWMHSWKEKHGIPVRVEEDGKSTKSL